MAENGQNLRFKGHTWNPVQVLWLACHPSYLGSPEYQHSTEANKTNRKQSPKIKSLSIKENSIYM